jgi:hypothetical protein
MTLAQKIVALISFMAIVMLVVFCWFASHMYRRMDRFTMTWGSERQAILKKRDQRIKNLNSKAENMGEEMTSFLDGVVESLKRAQKEREEFDEEFLKSQNSVFNAINSFNNKKK